MSRPPPTTTLFPYTTLFRSGRRTSPTATARTRASGSRRSRCPPGAPAEEREIHHREPVVVASPDRKSTRLNSSHSQISYAVFCLKKKKKKYTVSSTTLSALL